MNRVRRNIHVHGVAGATHETRRQTRLHLAATGFEDHQRVGAKRLDHACDPAQRCVVER